MPWIDDVVQETLLAVHRARQTYDPGRPFAPWFYAVASSRLIDVIEAGTPRDVARDCRRRPARGADWGRDDRALTTSTSKRFTPRWSSLPARQREVIEALKFRDQSVREVAGRLSMTESAVKVTAHRGYRALKRLLGGDARED